MHINYKLLNDDADGNGIGCVGYYFANVTPVIYHFIISMNRSNVSREHFAEMTRI